MKLLFILLQLRILNALVATNITFIAAGEFATCVILADKDVRCFGKLPQPYEYDQLQFRSIRIALPLNREPVEVAVSASTICVLFQDGGVRCGGDQQFAQTGTRSTIPEKIWLFNGVDVDFGLDRRAFHLRSGRSHSCVITRPNNETLCWGRSDFYQTGIPELNQSSYGGNASHLGDLWPAIDFGNERFATKLALGMIHSCFLLSDKSVTCLGGDGATLTDSSVIQGLLGIGPYFGILGSHKNEYGDNLTTLNLQNVIDLSCSYYHCSAVTESGDLFTWGNNKFGELGTGLDDDYQIVPFQVSSLQTTSVNVGAYFTIVGFSNGQFCGLGSNYYHVFSKYASSRASFYTLDPIDLLAPNEQVKNIVTGAFHICFHFHSNKVKCFGRNIDFESGIPGTYDKFSGIISHAESYFVQENFLSNLTKETYCLEPGLFDALLQGNIFSRQLGMFPLPYSCADLENIRFLLHSSRSWGWQSNAIDQVVWNDQSSCLDEKTNPTDCLWFAYLKYIESTKKTRMTSLAEHTDLDGYVNRLQDLSFENRRFQVCGPLFEFINSLKLCSTCTNESVKRCNIENTTEWNVMETFRFFSCAEATNQTGNLCQDLFDPYAPTMGILFCSPRLLNSNIGNITLDDLCVFKLDVLISTVVCVLLGALYSWFFIWKDKSQLLLLQSLSLISIILILVLILAIPYQNGTTSSQFSAIFSSACGLFVLILSALFFFVIKAARSKIRVFDVEHSTTVEIFPFWLMQRPAIVSWRWDIENASDFHNSVKLQECFLRAKELKHRYVMVDVVSLDQNSIDSSAVLNFISAYQTNPVIVAISNSQEKKEYEKRFWCEFEMFKYSRNHQVKTLTDGLDPPKFLYHNIDELILDVEQVHVTFNFDRLRVFLLTLPFPLFFFSVILRNIKQYTLLKKDISNDLVFRKLKDAMIFKKILLVYLFNSVGFIWFIACFIGFGYPYLFFWLVFFHQNHQEISHFCKQTALNSSITMFLFWGLFVLPVLVVMFVLGAFLTSYIVLGVIGILNGAVVFLLITSLANRVIYVDFEGLAIKH